MKRFKDIIPVFLCVMALCCGCGDYSEAGRGKNTIQKIDTAMGTIISQTLYVTEDSDVSEEVLQVITDLERKRLSWRLESSELYAINGNAGKEGGTLLSEEMKEILEECLEVSRLSEGSFDITIGEVVRMWDIDAWAGMIDVSGYELPSETDIQESLADIGYEKLVLREMYCICQKTCSWI